MKQVIYVASPQSQQIHVWQMSAEGELTLLQVVDVRAQVQPMVVHPQKNILYTGVRPDYRVLAWHIDANGRLSIAGEAALPGSPTHISTDRYGRWLFCASYNDACVSVSPLDDDGLPQVPIQVEHGLAGCHSANIDNANQTLFTPALKQDRICLYQLSANGRLQPPPQAQVNSAAGAGPRHMAFHPDGQYAYSVNELAGTVDVWRLGNAAGEVEAIQSLNMLPPGFNDTPWAADIHLTPDGCYLYACERTGSTIAIFRVSEQGASLTIVGHQPTETQPRGFNIDNEGRYLVAAGQKSNQIEVYRIEQQQGTLTPLKRYAVGEGPMWVVFHVLPE